MSNSPTLLGHVKIARPDHWIKNVFVVPGAIAAISVQPADSTANLLIRFVLGLISTCLVASSNYTINELLDASHDRGHPVKKNRPVPSGLVSIPMGYLQWLLLFIAGLAVASLLNREFLLTMAGLWIMGIVYNVRPIRTKEVPYLDVLSEAVNNPIRMLAGWYIVSPDAIAPLSLLLSYWMVGCYFMALKRFAELRSIGDREVAGEYRSSFRYYTEEKLLVSVMFYASASMLFLGVFIVRYRMELILSFPMVALVMAIYLRTSLKPDSVVQAPESLYKERALMAAISGCSLLIAGLLFLDIPILYQWFAPLTQAPF